MRNRPDEHSCMQCDMQVQKCACFSDLIGFVLKVCFGCPCTATNVYKVNFCVGMESQFIYHIMHGFYEKKRM